MHAVVSLLLAFFMSQATPAATGRMAGRVTADGTHAPIAGARIMVILAGRPSGPTGMPPQATTDQDGRFVFDSLTPGDYFVEVQKTGFAPPSIPTVRPRRRTVVAGQLLDGVNFQLQKGAAISGRVLDQKGEPSPTRA